MARGRKRKPGSIRSTACARRSVFHRTCLCVVTFLSVLRMATMVARPQSRKHTACTIKLDAGYAGGNSTKQTHTCSTPHSSAHHAPQNHLTVVPCAPSKGPYPDPAQPSPRAQLAGSAGATLRPCTEAHRPPLRVRLVRARVPPNGPDASAPPPAPLGFTRRAASGRRLAGACCCRRPGAACRSRIRR